MVLGKEGKSLFFSNEVETRKECAGESGCYPVLNPQQLSFGLFLACFFWFVLSGERCVVLSAKSGLLK